MGDDAPGRRGGLPSAARSGAFVLGAGAVSWAWSEVGYWSRFRSQDSVGTWLLTWLLYTVATAVVLRVVRRYTVRDLPGLVLVGALYGWIVEGVLAATVYTSLPFSLVWTGVAWHGLLTVVVGWWALPRRVVRGGPGAVGWCLLVGAAWGAWSSGWWAAPPDEGENVATTDVLPFVAFVLVVSAAAIVGYALMAAVPLRAPALSSRTGLVLTVAVLVVWGALFVVAVIPWAPVLLATLVGLVLLSLRRRDDGPAPAAGPVLGWEPGVPLRRAAPLLGVPAAAVAVHALLAPLAPAQPGEGLLYVAFVASILVLGLAGAVALAWSLWQVWRRTPRRAARAAA